MKKSEILIAARKTLEKGFVILRGRTNTSKYVCDHIMWAANELERQHPHSDAYNKMHELHEMIANSIEHLWSVKDWLIYKGIPKDQLTDEALQEYRLRWVDSMIADFQAKGD